MNSLGELVMVRCQRCLLEGRHNWFRIENAYPAIFLADFFNPVKVEFITMKEKMYLCKQCNDKYIQIEKSDSLELPKN